MSLATLHVGRGFEMTASQTEPVAPCDAYKTRANYLSQLTNLHRLRNLQLDGDNVPPVAWGTLTPELLPNLRSLTIQDFVFRPLSALCNVATFKKHFRPFSGTQAGQDFKQQIVFTIGSRWMAFLQRDAILFGGVVSTHNPRVNFWADLGGADELGAFFAKTRMLSMAVDELDRFYAQLLVCNSLEAMCPRGFWSMERKLQHLSSLDGLAESDSDEFWWRGPGE